MTQQKQLSPEIMALLGRMYQNYRPGETQVPYFKGAGDEFGYHARFGEPTYNGEGNQLSMGPITGYTVGNYDPSSGSTMSIYDTSGKDTGQTEYWEKDKEAWMDTAAMAALGVALGGVTLYGPNGLLAGGGVPGAGGITGAEAAAANGSWDAVGGLTAAESQALGGAGAAGGAAGGAGTITGPAASNTAFDAALKTAGGAAGSTVLADVLKYGLPILGAVAGAQGQKNEQTQTRDIPEWLKPSVIGDGKDNPGLLGHTNNLLQASMTPQRMAEWDAIRTRGLEGLQAPSMGNGYSRFFGNSAPTGSGYRPVQFAQNTPMSPALMSLLRPSMG